MTLHTKILDAARDEVARKHGFSNFKGVWSMGISYPVIVEEAALLAMEKQAWFHWWANKNYVPQENKTWLAYDEQGNLDTRKTYTELELYEIWELSSS